MAIDADVLVVGGGLAGSTAALAAAETGAAVRLVSHKQSTLRHASGLVDVLGYTPDGEGPLAAPFDALDGLPDGHPYRRAGTDALRAGLALFDAVAGDAYAGGHTERNALVPTHGGTVKPTARYPASVAAGLASDDRETLLVGFETVTDFDAPLAAAHLRAAGVPFAVRGVTVEFPGELRPDAAVTRFSRALDRDETVGGTGVRAALADRIEPHLDGGSSGESSRVAERVGVPAVLGDDHAAAVRDDLESRLGVDVFEVPTGPPSLLGRRLESLLVAALEDAGVRIETGNPAVGYEADGDRVTAVRVDHNGREVPYGAGQVVLATGGLVGKGVDSDREGVYEPLFDCHVPHPADRYDWSAEDAFGDHPFARFGVAVDASMRPLDAADRPEFENLRAAGGVIGGADVAAEKSAAGVSLATGHAAGRAAGERGRA